MWWVWDEGDVDNMLMFSVVANQSRTFQLLLWACQRAAGVRGELGGGTARTADPSGAKGRAIPCDVMLRV